MELESSYVSSFLPVPVSSISQNSTNEYNEEQELNTVSSSTDPTNDIQNGYFSAKTEVKSGLIGKTLSRAKTLQRKLIHKNRNMFVVIKRRYTMVSSGSTAKEVCDIKSKQKDSGTSDTSGYTNQEAGACEIYASPGNVNSTILYSSNDTLFSSADASGLQLNYPRISNVITRSLLVETPELTNNETKFIPTSGFNPNQSSNTTQNSDSLASPGVNFTEKVTANTRHKLSASSKCNDDKKSAKNFKTVELPKIDSSSGSARRNFKNQQYTQAHVLGLKPTLNSSRVISISDIVIEKKMKPARSSNALLHIKDQSTFKSYRVSKTPFEPSTELSIPTKSLFSISIKDDCEKLPVNKYYMHNDDYKVYTENLEIIYNQFEEEFFGALKIKVGAEKSIEILTRLIYEDLNCKTVRQSIAIFGFCYEFGLGVKCDFAKCEKLYKPSAIKGNALSQSRLAFLKKYGRPGIKIDRTQAAKWTQKVKANVESSAVSWLEKASFAYSLAEAQYALGLCYHDGIGVKVDDKKAFQLYFKSAKQGNSRGQGILGYCYGEGFGVKQDKSEAVKWYMLAAGQGESVAMYNLGYCYEDGIGVARNPYLAVEWYRKAAEKGNAFAQNSLGYCHEDGLGVNKDPNEAVKWYRLSAMQGYPWAECNLGYCYQYGIGVEESAAQATYWYLRAAKQGHARAQHNLGYCYQNGIWVEKDEKKAVMWYHKAAEKGNIYAYHSLGYCYQNGTGVGIQLEEAVKWYRMAAVKNHPPAQLSLGYCYRNGIGVEKNDQEAFKWFQESAKSGNALAQNSLGYCYEEGIGTPQNLKLAFHFYTKSASQNNPWAICNVGYCYAQGIGVAQNLEKAVYLYRIAAQMDHARAMEKLGLALLEGVGTAKDEVQAVKWFRNAAEKFSHAPAMHWLGVCLERGIGIEHNETEAIRWYQKAIIHGDATAIERLRSLLLVKYNGKNKNNAKSLIKCFNASSAA